MERGKPSPWMCKSPLNLWTMLILRTESTQKTQLNTPTYAVTFAVRVRYGKYKYTKQLAWLESMRSRSGARRSRVWCYLSVQRYGPGIAPGTGSRLLILVYLGKMLWGLLWSAHRASGLPGFLRGKHLWSHRCKQNVNSRKRDQASLSGTPRHQWKDGHWTISAHIDWPYFRAHQIF